MIRSQGTLSRVADAVARAPAAELLVDTAGQVHAASESCVVVFERPLAELRGDTLADLERAGYLAGITDAYEAVVGAFRDGERDPQTLRFSVRPGSHEHDRLPYRAEVRPVTDGGGRLVGTRWLPAAVGAEDRYEETLEALHRSTRELVGATDELAVYDHVGRAANEILGMPGTGVRTYDPDTETLRHVTFGNEETVIDTRPPRDVDGTPQGEAFLSGETRREAVGYDDDHDREVFTHVMYVPVGEFGTLSLGRVGVPFAGMDVRFAEILAENAAAALQDLNQRERLASQRADLQRYETILETVPDPVFVADSEGEITVANSAFESTFTDGEDATGHHYTDFVSAPDAAALETQVDALRAAESADETVVDMVGLTDDGHRRQFDVSLALLPGNEGAGTTGVLRDVTDRRRREEVLSVTNRTLRHNLRTRANAILGYTDLVDEDFPPEHQEYLDRVREATDWLVKLGETLRTLERTFDDGSTDRPVDTLVEQVTARFRERYPDATVETATETTRSLPGGDALAFALANLVENAIVHNRGPARVRVTAEPGDREGWVTVRVADDGPGVPERERDLVFGEEEVSQLDHSQGIGLWVTRWIVETFDGTVEVETGSGLASDPESTGPGPGTVATLRLRTVGD